MLLKTATSLAILGIGLSLVLDMVHYFGQLWSWIWLWPIRTVLLDGALLLFLCVLYSKQVGQKG